MKNMLLNYDFKIPYNNEPMYFILEGNISYDRGEILSSRTLSLTMKDDEASVTYEPFIDVSRARAVTAGFLVRAVGVDYAACELTFYDDKFQPITCKSLEFTHCIGYAFTNVANNFRTPKDAAYCTVRIKFIGSATALTLYKPYFKKG